MKLQQYLASFNEPLRTEDVTNLIRLLSCRNKTARGLSDTIGPVDVRYTLYTIKLPARRLHVLKVMQFMLTICRRGNSHTVIQ